MNKQKNISSFETACWFYQKALADKIRITDSKIQHLLFLSQLHYALKHGSYLMPTLFVCFDRGFYEASVQNILSYGIPPISFTDMAHTDFLELIWQKYGQMPEDKLRQFILSLDCFKNCYRPERETVVNPLNFADSFSQDLQSHKNTSSTTKVLISQNGPVKVSAWTPRKLTDQKK